MAIRTPDPYAALVAGALAAAVVGLAGLDAGLLFIVAGVWTIRAIAGGPVGIAWGIACLGAGLRWGTTSLGDLAVATRLNGPTLVSGSAVVRAGMLVALVGAAVGEARVAGLHSRATSERTAAAIAIVTVVAVFGLAGPGEPASLLSWRPLLFGPLWWCVGAFMGAALVVVLRRFAVWIPSWVPVACSVAGIASAAMAS